MRKRQINWCSIGMCGVLVFQYTQYDLILIPMLFSKILAIIYLVKTIAMFFCHGNLEMAFGRLLIAITISALCSVVFKIYDHFFKNKIENKYEIDRMITYCENHLAKPNSRIMRALRAVETLALVIIALAPGVGVCYGLYLVTTRSYLAITVLALSVLAIILLYALARSICVVAWRKM